MNKVVRFFFFLSGLVPVQSSRVFLEKLRANPPLRKLYLFMEPRNLNLFHYSRVCIKYFATLHECWNKISYMTSTYRNGTLDEAKQRVYVTEIPGPLAVFFDVRFLKQLPF